MTDRIVRPPFQRPFCVNRTQVAGMTESHMESVVTQLDRVLSVAGLSTTGVWAGGETGWYVQVEDDSTGGSWGIWDEWFKQGMAAETYYVHRVDKPLHRVCAGLESVAAYIHETSTE